MPKNQINGVDETANVTVGFDRHEVLRQRFQLFKVSYRAIISFYSRCQIKGNNVFFAIALSLDSLNLY